MSLPAWVPPGGSGFGMGPGAQPGGSTGHRGPLTWTRTDGQVFALPQRAVLAKAAETTAARQAVVAADGAPIRVTYGLDRIGAQILTVLPYQGRLVLDCIWGEGPIDAIEALDLDGTALPLDTTVNHYLGEASPVSDPLLAAAWAAAGRTYTDTLPDIAHSVIHVRTDLEVGFPRPMARLRGRKVFDPRSGLTAYSTNPALALADFLSHARYGGGYALDWDSVADAADACDETVGGEARRRIGLTLAQAQDEAVWFEALRAYAGCFVVDRGGVLVLVPDRPVAASASFSHAAGQILKMGDIRSAGRDLPTVVEVEYTNTESTPWSVGRQRAKAAGVDAGTVPYRLSRVQMPGGQWASQMLREATERLNHFWLEGLTVGGLEVGEEAAAVEPGDVVGVTHPDLGEAELLLRVLDKRGGRGRWALDLRKYDPARYSNAVTTTPTWSDTSLPSPAAPPAPTGIALSEEVYQLENGLYASRIRATWDDDDYPYRLHWRVDLRAGSSLIRSDTVDAAEWRSPAVQEGVSYSVEVAQVSRIGMSSAAASDVIVAQGKQLAPGNVPGWVQCFEAGGVVYAVWLPAVDLDITRYELRYGLTSGTWETATLIDRVDGLSKEIKGLPAGTWRLYVAALDSVGQYSPAPLTRDLAVTLDASALLVGSHVFSAPTLTSMSAYRAARTDGLTYVTDFGDGLGYGHADPDNATGIFADLAAVPFAHPHTAGTSTWLSESHDFGQVLTGNWTAEAAVTDLSGTALMEIELSDDGSAWAAQTGPSIVGTGRFARVRISTTGTMTVAAGVTLRIDAVPRTENGVVTTTATGPTVIALDNDYTTVKGISVSPSGSVARSATWDNVVLTPGACSFDIYVFDASGVQIAADVSWSFEGI